MALNILGKLKKRHHPLQNNADHGMAALKNILTDDSPFHISEAYKALRTNVTFSLPNAGCKIIAITSANAAEGKSTNCLNLAVTFAETGVKVLLIDCDLRRPNIAKLLGKKSTPGISNVLVHVNKLEDVIQATPYENLHVIFSGEIPPNPAELLGSQATEDVLAELAKKYDYIFLDTPPVNNVTDTSILSKFVSGVVVIVRQNKTEKGALLDTIGQLEFVGAKILGFVMNGMPAGGGYGGYKYKGYYKNRKYAASYSANEA